MSRQSTAAIKKFAKRHHLHVQRDVDEDNVVPASSVFRHREARDEVLAVGAVHQLDIRCAQRSLPVAVKQPDRHVVTILSLAHPALKNDADVLFVHHNLTPSYALAIKHLRGRWQHTHAANGTLFTPPHQTIDANVLSAIEQTGVTVEHTANTLTLAASPALKEDKNIQELLDKAQKLIEKLVSI